MLSIVEGFKPHSVGYKNDLVMTVRTYQAYHLIIYDIAFKIFFWIFSQLQLLNAFVNCFLALRNVIQIDFSLRKLKLYKMFQSDFYNIIIYLHSIAHFSVFEKSLKVVFQLIQNGLTQLCVLD